MPHAPFFVFSKLTASLRHVGGFPASGFTAFPVNSGSSDYYGSSVALPIRVQAISVQSNQNNSFPYCRVRLSPFTHYSWLPCLEYSAVIQNGNITAKTLHVSTPFMQKQSYALALAIVQAIQLLPSYTYFHSHSKAACQEILITSLPSVF